MIIEQHENNGAFSPTIPKLQLAWDSVSSGAFQNCPRYYYYKIICGLNAPGELNVHLKFGQIWHSSLERYDHSRLSGATHEEALRVAVKFAFTETWDSTRKRPWISGDTNKNRQTLLRSIIWYCDQFQDDPIKIVALDNGKPAVELSFRLDLDYKPLGNSNETFMLCGHLDKVGELNGDLYVCDKKTTKYSLDQNYFDNFNPDNQFEGYAFAGRIITGSPLVGVICDAAQIGVNFSRFSRQPIPFSEENLDEWYTDFGWMVRQAEQFAKANYWPKNRKSCFNYGRACDFRKLCCKPPSIREDWIKVNYDQHIWDPTQIRGNI